MPKTLKKSGTVQSFNVSPKGIYEGLVIEEGGQVLQINFPHHLSAAISEMVKVGSAIECKAAERPLDKPHEHPVYELLALEGKSLKQLEKSGGSDQNGNSFSGTVKRLNYALHGEVNGGILDTGDFLHLKPKGAASVGLKTGMKVKGHGPRKSMPGGKSVIEAEEVNGIKIEHKPKPKKHAH